MRKLLIIVAVLLALLAFTNPTKDEFVSWGQAQMVNSVDNGFLKWGVSLLGKSYVENTANAKDYVFFTLYELPLGDKKETVLGVFNNFYPISSTAAYVDPAEIE